jgi:hypothetical protein
LNEKTCSGGRRTTGDPFASYGALVRQAALVMLTDGIAGLSVALIFTNLTPSPS